MTNAPIGAAASADRFRQALARILVHEGGKVDHPKDPGGRTNKGVTQRVYNAWRTKSHLPIRDVYLIDDSEVEAIYRFQYWEPIGGQQLPPGVGYIVMDGAVNSGVRQSGKWLQRSLGFEKSQVDGVIGSVTINATQQDHDHDTLIARICERRMVFLRALKTWRTFGKGWTRRVANVKATGQAWAMGTVGPAVEYVPGAENKASVDDAKKGPPKAPGDVSIGVGGAGATIPQAVEQLTPFEGIAFVKNLIVGLTILGAVILLGGAAWRWWATKKAKELEDALDTGVAA